MSEDAKEMMIPAGDFADPEELTTRFLKLYRERRWQRYLSSLYGNSLYRDPTCIGALKNGAYAIITGLSGGLFRVAEIESWGQVQVRRADNRKGARDKRIAIIVSLALLPVFAVPLWAITRLFLDSLRGRDLAVTLVQGGIMIVLWSAVIVSFFGLILSRPRNSLPPDMPNEPSQLEVAPVNLQQPHGHGFDEGSI